MQTRKRKLTVADRPTEVRSVSDFVRTDTVISDSANLNVDNDEPGLSELARDIDTTVRTDPAPERRRSHLHDHTRDDNEVNAATDTEPHSQFLLVPGESHGQAGRQSTTPSRAQKISVYSMRLDDPTPGEITEMKLLGLDEASRSHLMFEIVNSYQEKINTCFEQFKPELALSCLRIITSLSAKKPRPRTTHESGKTNEQINNPTNQATNPFAELDIHEAMQRELPNFTVSRLRAMVQQILRRATLRQDGTFHFSGRSPNLLAVKSVQYFVWYFEFMDHLHDLYESFVDKVFNPLFKYFYDFNSLGSNGRTNTMSSAFSKLSQFSDSQEKSDSFIRDGNDVDDMLDRERLRVQSKASLLQLSNAFKEIKSVYDTSEIEKVAQRISFLKDQLDFLMEEEDEVDPDLYSEESKNMIKNMNMDFGTENLIRLVPDLLVKLRKAGWLARRWLELDDMRTKNINEKIRLVTEIENGLTVRLNILNSDISKSEMKLETETNELNKLVDMEHRSEKMTLQRYDTDAKVANLEEKIKSLTEERDSFAPKLQEIVAKKDLESFQKLKFQFESNKLRRFNLQRQLATLKYQQNLLTDDLDLEMYVRPSIIHSVNKLQDECERLENILRDKREEAVTIKRALLPVHEDKTLLVNRQKRNEQMYTDQESARRISRKYVHPGQAFYIRSFRSKERPTQLKQDLLKHLPIGNAKANVLNVASPMMW